MAIPRLLEPAEVAEILRVPTSQVKTLMRNGSLKALKIGARGVWRVAEEDLREYIDRLRSDAERRGADELAAEDFEDVAPRDEG